MACVPLDHRRRCTVDVQTVRLSSTQPLSGPQEPEHKEGLLDVVAYQYDIVVWVELSLALFGTSSGYCVWAFEITGCPTKMWKSALAAC